MLLKLLALLFLTGCGYHVGTGELSQRYPTITVPFVEGDPDGTLTSTLIQELTKAGGFRYCREGGAARLKVTLCYVHAENIGFRYDLDKSNNELKTIVPVETRLMVEAMVEVIDSQTCVTLLGPMCISAKAEYDHDYYAGIHDSNTFSLGQLTDIDSARDSARTPLHQALAKKIADYVTQSW